MPNGSYYVVQASGYDGVNTSMQGGLNGHNNVHPYEIDNWIVRVA